MEAHAHYRDMPGAVPSILINRKPSDPFESRTSTGYSRYDDPSPAMSIPGAADRTGAPPPLPPPRWLPHHPPPPADYHDAYRQQQAPTSFHDRLVREEHGRRKMDHDEGYASLSTASHSSTRSRESLPSLSEFGLSHRGFQFNDSYDTDLKKKLDPIRTFHNRSPPGGRSLLSASAYEPRSRRYAPSETRLAPLSVPTIPPIHTTGVLESPDRWTETPLHSAVSPRAPPLALPHRSPRHHDGLDYDRSPQHRSRRTNSGSIPDDSTQGSHEVDEMEIDDTPPLGKLHIDEYQAGQKRRATSPPRDDAMHGLASQSDFFRRRDISSRGSPTPQRLGPLQQSSISTISTSRSGSYASNYSAAAPSSVTSMNSYGRRSPGGLSPGGMSPVATDPGCNSPFSGPISLNPSPRASMSRHPHQRTISQSQPALSPRKLNDMSKLAGSKMQGFLMCECCPKKPKKFDTAEELRAHEAEKQYECSFCGNRFKNKNEAERHQNSLHLRRHSWSCSALLGYDKAFHESTNRPGEADTCGYCGDEFPRNGRAAGNSSLGEATEADWAERIRHLTEVHKFRECNSSKKFYRADHFRQHLKHSHAGTSGKWTNMLENACMLDEEPPMPSR